MGGVRPGRAGAYFDGVDGYVLLPVISSAGSAPSEPGGSAGGLGGAGGFTVELGVADMAGPQAPWAQLFDFGNGAGRDNLWATLSPEWAAAGAAPALYFNADNTGFSAAPLGIAPSSTYYSGCFHLAVVVAPAEPGPAPGPAAAKPEAGADVQVRIYINGSLAAAKRFDESGQALLAPGAFRPRAKGVRRALNLVGASAWAGDPFFNGRLAEVALFDRALSGEQITAHFGAGEACSPAYRAFR